MKPNFIFSIALFFLLIVTACDNKTNGSTAATDSSAIATKDQTRITGMNMAMILQ